MACPIFALLNATTKAHIAVFCTNLFFATNYSLVKHVSPALIKPYALNVLRVGVCLLLFWIVWLFGRTMRRSADISVKPVRAGIRKEDMGRFLLCGLTGIAINQSLFIKGLTMTSTIHASLLMLCTPLLITILAFWILKEKVTVFKAGGIALGICGAYLLILSKDQGSQNTSSLTGDLFIMLNAIAYTFYFVLVKPLMNKYPPVHVIRWVFTFGFLMLLPWGWAQSTQIQWQEFALSHFAALSFIVIAGTFLAYYFNVIGIQHLGAGTTGSYIYTQPVFTAIIATLFLHENLTIQKIIAGLLIFTGVFLVSLKIPTLLPKASILRKRGKEIE